MQFGSKEPPTEPQGTQRDREKNIESEGQPVQLHADSGNKHQVFAFGPDVTSPVASKSKLFALINVRSLWEANAHVKTQGQTLAVTATFPVPSVRLK